ncbi:MAG: hypothetical protein QOG64_3034, partial [Acidimicrobiaceae bacterium]|nr:hypothetical protein [Acidimicrobiaceae bacterium]
MALQSVVFTCLPHGTNPQGIATITVHVAPRLTPPGLVPLATFDDWVNWPRTLLAGGEEVEPFTVEVDGRPVDARLNRDPLDPVLWDAVFGTAEVGTYQFRDLSGRDLRS